MKIIEKEANDLNLALCGRKKNSHEQYTDGKNGHPDIIKTCQLENSALAFSPYLTGKGKKMAFNPGWLRVWRNRHDHSW